MAMQESNNIPSNKDRKKRLILGGRTYTIDDDDTSVILPANEKSRTKEDNKNVKMSSMDHVTTCSNVNEDNTAGNCTIVTENEKDTHKT